jgi:hypothetical protein
MILGILAFAALAGAPKASSELTDSDGVKHPATLAFDGLLATGWAEGAPGPGDGAWIELKLDRATDVQSVTLWLGDLSGGDRSLRERGRPKTVTVTLTTAGGPVTQTLRLLDPAADGPKRVDIPIAGSATAVRVSADQAYEGGVYSDMYIAEIALNFTGGWVPPEVEKALKWQGTADAEKAAEKDKAQIIAWYDAIKAEQFGDAATLDKIEAQAADGAPFMQKRAAAVPYGFRMQAIPPDDVAIDAILKLKDPNAISALLLASLRTNGQEAAALASKVEYFEAYSEMIGGGDRNVANWGQSGWESGALQSFGEPLALAIDQLGQVYVADTGNNRVQRFNDQGKADKAWGGEATITNVWFSGTRKYYVSGGTPGDAAGSFTSPIDVAVVPGKKADGLAVLDAKGRISIISPEGTVTNTWKVGSDETIEAGVGGQAFIEVAGGKVVVIWAGRGYEYTLDGVAKSDWDITDGVPNGATQLPGGKIGLVFGKTLVMYGTDGFRHGTVLEDGPNDARGEGFESWDACLDEDGKLWVVTDTGLAIKYKKPGKVDWSVTITDFPLETPRVAAWDDAVFVTDRDKILRIDALELHAKALAAEADAK